MLLCRSEEQNREQMANTALVDAGDCRFAACAIFEHFSGFEFSLLAPSLKEDRND